jgi:hypothetical protein
MEFRRAPFRACGLDINIDDPTPPGLGPSCASDDGLTLAVTTDCAAPNIAVDPLFRRARDPRAADGWGPWEVVDNGCLSAVDVAGAIAQEFQRIPLTPPQLSVQPPSGWTLVNAETIAFTEDRSQSHSVTVLGINVTIRATPETFTWNFDDGSTPLVTSEPGRPWPDHTVAHRYETEGTHTISLTTTWSGTYQVAGSSEWLPVEGTATTTSTSPPLTVYEARSRLVSGSTG